MRVLFFFLLTLTVHKAISQESDSITLWKAASFITNLKANGVSKIAYKRDYCIGCYPSTITDIETDKVISFPCNYYFTLYIFWQSGNKGFIKKFDACGESASFELNPKKIFEIPDNYINLMKTEEIKSFSTREQNNSDTSVYVMWRDHGGFSDLFFFNGSDSLSKNIDFYPLLDESDGKKNLNYESNHQLKTVIWEHQLREMVNKLNEEKKLKTKN